MSDSHSSHYYSSQNARQASQPPNTTASEPSVICRAPGFGQTSSAARMHRSTSASSSGHLRKARERGRPGSGRSRSSACIPGVVRGVPGAGVDEAAVFAPSSKSPSPRPSAGLPTVNLPKRGTRDPSATGSGRSLLHQARRKWSGPCAAAVPRFFPRPCRAR